MGVQTAERGSREGGWLFAQRVIACIELKYTSEFERPTAVLLAAQATDERVNQGK
jgi:endonuclease III